MRDQDEHIEVLKSLATLSPEEFQMMRGQYLVKTTARDVIEAGRRLKNLGYSTSNPTKMKFKITVEYVSTNVSTNVNQKEIQKVKRITKRKK